MQRTWSPPTRRGLLGTLLVVLLGQPVFAQRPRPLPNNDNWEPLEEIGGIAVWFRKMSAEFDRYVDKEKRAQLWRSVDKLRKALYQLEQDSVVLLSLIPDAPPTDEERTVLGKQTSTLLGTVRVLSANLREIGADLRLSDPNEMWRVEERIFYGFRSRARALSYIERELSHSRESGQWQAVEMRDRLNKGIMAIQDAQKAVVAFHGQLDS